MNISVSNFKSRNTTIQKGFTIVELLIVIVVIAILASISVVAYNGIQQRARVTKQNTDLRAVSMQLQIDQLTNGGNYPVSNDPTFLASISQSGVKDPKDNGATSSRIGTTSFCQGGEPWIRKQVNECRGYGYLAFPANGINQAFGQSADGAGCRITAISNNPSYIISWYDEASNMVKFRVSSASDVSITRNVTSTTFPAQVCEISQVG